MNVGMTGIENSPGRIKPADGIAKQEKLTGMAFKQLVNQHMDEIARSQVAYQEYAKHGRTDLAQGAHEWASQQRNRLQQLGLSEYPFQQDLSARFTGKYSPEQAPIYDSAKPGRHLKGAGDLDSSSQRGNVAYRTAASQAAPRRSFVESAPAEIKESILKAAGQVGIDPNLIASLAYRESGFNDAALSAKGAIGLLQLMPETAEGLGVNPFDAYSNILGGATYLKEQLKKYGGDLKLALAAYNAGPGHVDEAIKKAGNHQNWAAVSHFLPDETRKYVTSVLNSYSRM